MANRKRGTFSLPEELQTTEKLTTKKELALRNLPPSCPPVPYKLRKSIFASRNAPGKPKTVYFTHTTNLSPFYNPTLPLTYIEQIYVKHSIVGEGSFGIVYKARSREDGKYYAIKCLKATTSRSDSYAEIKNNEKIGVNPYCVQFFMAWEEMDETYMKLEYCNMSLADYGRKNNDIEEELLWDVLHDICKALQYLHGKGLIHLDVKPANIMMKNGYYKLGDFGLLFDEKVNHTVTKSTLSDGDSKYLALEVLQGVYTPACDIFGLGISLLELSADLELPDHGPLWQQLRKEILPPSFYDRASKGFAVIVERMVSPVYEQRPSADKILKFNSLRAIEKRDGKIPRINYCVQTESNDENFVLLTSPVTNNNVVVDKSSPQETTTVPRSPESSRLNLRKSLKFPLEAVDKSMDSNYGSPGFLSLDEAFGDSPRFMSTFSGEGCSESGLGSSIFDTSMETDSEVVNNNPIASTPIVKKRTSSSRFLPKARLTFN